MSPIRWSAESMYVLQAKAYAEAWILENQVPPEDDPQYRKITVKHAVMNRISHNLCNPNWRAYPSEIAYSTVLDAIKRELNPTEIELMGWITALDSVWNEVRRYFTLHFTKPQAGD